MQTFSDTYELPGDVETVIGLMATEEYYQGKYAIMEARNVQVDVLTDNENEFQVAVARDVSLGDSIPSFAKSFVSDNMTIHQKVTWQKQGGTTRQGLYSGQLMGKEGGVQADLFLEPNASGSGCQMRIEGRIKVGIPLVGRKIEKLMAERASEAFENDLAATKQYLQQKLA